MQNFYEFETLSIENPGYFLNADSAICPLRDEEITEFFFPSTEFQTPKYLGSLEGIDEIKKKSR